MEKKREMTFVENRLNSSVVTINGFDLIYYCNVFMVMAP